MSSPQKTPFKVEITSGGFGEDLSFPSQQAAYAEAHRIKVVAETGQSVGFTDDFGRSRLRDVLCIRILRWNPHADSYMLHAHRWVMHAPSSDALTPIPADWDA